MDRFHEVTAGAPRLKRRAEKFHICGSTDICAETGRFSAAAIAGCRTASEAICDPGDGRVRALGAGKAVADARQLQHPHAASGAAELLHVICRYLRSHEGIGGALRKEDGKRCRQRAGRVAFEQRAPGLDLGGIFNGQELLRERPRGAGADENVERRFDALPRKAVDDRHHGGCDNTIGRRAIDARP
jgi:hypothetical protein